MDIDKAIFQYGTGAHFTLALAYFLYNENIQKITGKNIVKFTSIVTLLYLAGHSSIFVAMLTRINKANIGKQVATLSGVTGHTCLLLFGILFFYLPAGDKTFDVIWDKDIYKMRNMIFIAGQIGMMYTYISEHLYSNKSGDVNKPLYSQIISFVTFTALAYFYLTKVHISRTHNSHIMILIGLFLVGMLYAIFALKGGHKLLIEMGVLKERKKSDII
jgi:hypothetical protein